MALLDDLDIAILAFIADHPKATVTDCAKSIFEPEDTEELQKKDSMLRHRFRALVSSNFLVTSLESNRSTYIIADERVIFEPNFRSINIGGRTVKSPEIENDYCILVFTSEGVIVRSLDKLEKKWKE